MSALDLTVPQVDRQRAIIKRVKEIVASHWGFTVEDLDRRGRGTQRLSDCRHVAIVMSRLCSKASYPDLAAAFNRADHESARHAERVVDRRLMTDAAFKESYTAIWGLVHQIIAREFSS